MTSKNNGGAAFPGVVEAPAGARPGMSLRDYFAGQALDSCIRLASEISRYAKDGGSPLSVTGHYELPWTNAAAKAAYEMADAMLAQRKGAA